MQADRQSVLTARKQFFAGKTLPVDSVSHAILRSWIRCAEMGLDERRLPNIEPPTSAELKQLQDRYETLRRISRPELDALYGEARELSGIVILTNAKGEVLDAVGDAHFASRAGQLALRPGVRWSEDGTGTNAIGTALAERRAVVVNGPEHYFQDHEALSCAATPILDPRGAVLGVLDISLPAQPQAGHVLGLVRLAVEQIEHRLFRSGFEGCQTLRFQSDPNLLGAAREGILVLREGVVVGANRRGLSLIGRGYDGIDQMRIEDIFADPRLLETPQGRVTTQDGREFFAAMDMDYGSGGDLGAASREAGERAASSMIDPSGGHAAQSLEAVELAVMRTTLDAQGGNVSAAARILGVHRSTLYRRLNIRAH
jgi:sigma-54 dependent transcriptional regulator, acetoin dehydrogenase operon transcriptional activator AcoR